MTDQTSQRFVYLHAESGRSLFVESCFNGESLASGTAFVAQARRGPLLITNRHNVTGRHPGTGEPLSPTAGIPNQIRILHHHVSKLGAWQWQTESLYHAEDEPRWIEHPIHGAGVDVAGLPLTELTEVQLNPFPLDRDSIKLFVGPAEPVSVIGFPFGIAAAGAFPIWATGFMATEPDIDFGGFPVFLIDCRARPGQSGSPVVALRRGGYSLEDGSAVFGTGTCSRLLGVYSGRINDQSDLGIVWKASVVDAIVDAYDAGS